MASIIIPEYEAAWRNNGACLFVGGSRIARKAEFMKGTIYIRHNIGKVEG